MERWVNHTYTTTNKYSIPNFGRGLDVLVVDDDKVSLMRLASMLQQFYYMVSFAERATVALSMIWGDTNKYKLVLVNCNMPDIDPFFFLHLLHKKKIPLILMSSVRDLNLARLALVKGASYFIEKPVSMDDLRYVWQHLYCTMLQHPNKENQNGAVLIDDFGFIDCGRIGTFEEGDHSMNRKSRMTWRPELHQKFVDAITKLGNKKAYPSSILRLMDEPGLTLRQVSNHLQKYKARIRGAARNNVPSSDNERMIEESHSSEIQSSPEYADLLKILEEDPEENNCFGSELSPEKVNQYCEWLLQINRDSKFNNNSEFSNNSV